MRRILIAWTIVASGCGGGTTAATNTPGGTTQLGGTQPSATSTTPMMPAGGPVTPLTVEGLAVANYFPLEHGHLYNYDTEGDDGSRGRLLAKAERRNARQGVLITGGKTKMIFFENDGVYQSGDTGGRTPVLKAPLTIGTTWPGKEGSTITITSVGTGITVPAGTYDDCVHTTEARRGDRPVSIVSVYCAGVGLVSLEAAGAKGSISARLRSYGPQIDLGPSGVKVIKPGQ